MQNALVPPRAYDELTTRGVALVLRSLFAGDCQTCEEPLGDMPSSVEFRQLGTRVEASLHHRACAAPEWITNCREQPARNITCHYFIMHLQWTGLRDRPRVITLVAINPSLETVDLTVDGNGVRVHSGDEYGFVPYAQTTVGHPTPGVRLVVDARIPAPSYRLVWVMAQGRPVWPLELEEATVQEAEAAGGLLLLVTHQLDPNAIADDALESGAALADLFGHANTYAAWATFLMGTSG